MVNDLENWLKNTEKQVENLSKFVKDSDKLTDVQKSDIQEVLKTVKIEDISPEIKKLNDTLAKLKMM